MFLLGHTNIFHCEQTEAITLFQANKSDSLYFFQRISPTPLHFSKRIKYKSYKVFWSYDLFPIIKYPLGKKTIPQTTEIPRKSLSLLSNKHSVTYQRKCPIIQHLVSDSGHSQKGWKEAVQHVYAKQWNTTVCICPYILCICQNRGCTD